jgi:hypothetical protein
LGVTTNEDLVMVSNREKDDIELQVSFWSTGEESIKTK